MRPLAWPRGPRHPYRRHTEYRPVLLAGPRRRTSMMPWGLNVTAAMRRARAYGRPRRVVMRILLTIGLIAPAAFLFIDLRNYIDVRASASVRELLGVEYLRALEPLGTALGETQAAVISAASASIDAAGKRLEERIA